MRFLNSIRFSVWEHTIGWLDLFGIGDRGDPWNCCLFQDWMVNGPMPNPFSATLNDSQGLPGVYPAPLPTLVRNIPVRFLPTKLKMEKQGVASLYGSNLI